MVCHCKFTGCTSRRCICEKGQKGCTDEVTVTFSFVYFGFIFSYHQVNFNVVFL